MSNQIMGVIMSDGTTKKYRMVKAFVQSIDLKGNPLLIRIVYPNDVENYLFHELTDIYIPESELPSEKIPS